MTATPRWRTTAYGVCRAVRFALVLGAAACQKFDNTPTAPEYGFVHVTINTSGGDPDVDGYVVMLDNLQFAGVTKVSTYVPPGQHAVSIGNVASNCVVTGSASRAVSTVVSRIEYVTFDVVCVATGITVTTRTSGPDSPDSLRMTLDAKPMDLGANSTQTVGRLTPGDHQVTVTVPANCTLTGGNSIIVGVAASQIASIALDVSCTPATRLPKIAYSAVKYVGNTAVAVIELVNVDGTEAKSIRDGDAPAWSPDGKRLVFSDILCTVGGDWYYYYYYGSEVNCTGGLIVADPEVGNVTRLKGGEGGAHPSWSSTGGGIVFSDSASSTSAPSRLRVLSPPNTAPMVLAIPPVQSARHPAWSPDGTRIAFSCEWGTRTDLCVADANGSNAVHLNDDTELDLEPAWSPDGKTLAFARYPAGRTNDESAEVALMDVATRQITVLGPGADPAWSPDGSKLVYAGIEGIFVMNADGSGRTRLTTGRHRAPAWRPNVR